MANEQNLIPFNKQTEDQQRENASKGGKASGETRKRKKKMREQLELLLSLPAKDENAKEFMNYLGITNDDFDNQMLLIMAMYKKALDGDVGAFNTLRDTVGDKPIDKVETINISSETVEEVEAYANKFRKQ